MFREGFLQAKKKMVLFPTLTTLNCYFFFKGEALQWIDVISGFEIILKKWSWTLGIIPLFAGTCKGGCRSSSAAWWCSSVSLCLLYPDGHHVDKTLATASLLYLNMRAFNPKRHFSNAHVIPVKMLNPRLMLSSRIRESKISDGFFLRTNS